MSPRNKDGGGSRGSDSQKSENSDGEDYRRRRERNNQAVKKSRVKSKLRTQQTLERVHQLKLENEMLEEKIKMLTKELSFLKDLFLAHAGYAHGVNLDDVDLETLLQDDPAEAGPKVKSEMGDTDDDSREMARIESLQAGEMLHLREEGDDGLAAQ